MNRSYCEERSTVPCHEVGEAPVVLQQLVPLVGKGLEEVEVQPDRVRRHLQGKTDCCVRIKTEKTVL